MPFPSYQNASRFPACPWRLVVARDRLNGMSHGYFAFSDIEGRLDMLRLGALRATRKGRYSMAKLIEKRRTQRRGARSPVTRKPESELCALADICAILPNSRQRPIPMVIGRGPAADLSKAPKWVRDPPEAHQEIAECYRHERTRRARRPTILCSNRLARNANGAGYSWRTVTIFGQLGLIKPPR